AAGAPGGATAARARPGVGPAPMEADFMGSDFIAVINLGAGAAAEVGIAVGPGDPITQLRQRGSLLRAAGFEGEPIDELDAGQVWVTLVADSIAAFELAADGAKLPGELAPGEALYLGGCYADCDASGSLDFFDFLCFQNAFSTGAPYADCDASGSHDFFDFLCFQNEF